MKSYSEGEMQPVYKQSAVHNDVSILRESSLWPPSCQCDVIEITAELDLSRDSTRIRAPPLQMLAPDRSSPGGIFIASPLLIRFRDDRRNLEVPSRAIHGDERKIG